MLSQILGENPNYMPAVRLLENIFVEEARHEDLAGLYTNILEHEKIDEASVGEYSLKLAKLLNLELNRGNESEPYYLKAIDNDFGFNTAIEALDQLYSQSLRFKELADLLQSVLKQVREESYLFNIVYRLAIIQLEYLDQHKEGLTNLLQAYQIDSAHEPLFWDLARHLEKHKQWSKLADIYMDQSLIVATPVKRIELRKSALRYLTLAGDLDKAGEVSNQILREREDDVDTINFLIDLHQQAQTFDKLPTLLKKSIALQTSEAEKLRLSKELAAVYDERLGQPEAAAEIVEKLLESSDEQYSLLANLERLYLKSRNWEKLIGLYPRLLESIHDSQSVLKIRLRFGEALEHVDKDMEALEIYRSILEIDGKQSDARNRIRALLEKHALWKELIEFLHEDAAIDTTDPAPLWQAGEIFEEHLENLQEAVTCHRSALERSDTYLPSYRSLARVFHNTNQYDNFLAITAKELEIQSNQERAVDLRLKRGRILRDHIDKAQEGLLEFQYGLQIENQSKELLRELATTYESLQQWQQAITTYDKLIDLSPVSPDSEDAEKEAASNLFYRLGEIALEGLKDEDLCISYNEKALEVTPYFQESLHKLRDLYRKQQSWDKLIEVYERNIEVLISKDATKALPLFLDLAEVHDKNLENTNHAIRDLLRAVKIDKNYIPARVALGELYCKDKTNYPKAIQELLFLLTHDELSKPRFKKISWLYEELDKFDHLCRVYELMDFLDILDNTDRDIYNSYAQRIPKTYKGSIDATAASRFIFHPYEKQPIAELAYHVLPELGAFGTYNRSTLGLSKKDRINPKERSHLKELVDRICTCFGLEPIDVYVKTGLGLPTVLIYDDSPALVADTDWVRGWNKHQLSFFFACELSQLVHCRGLAIQLEPYGLERLLRLVLLPFLKEKPPNTPEIEEDLKRIKKLLKRKTRKWVEENGEKLASSLEKTNFAQWVQGIQLSSLRSGIIFTNKLAESIHCISQAKNLEGKPWDSPLIREMTLYLLSEEAAQARKLLGTSIYSV